MNPTNNDYWVPVSVEQGVKGPFAAVF